MEPDGPATHIMISPSPHQSPARPQPLCCHFGGFRDASRSVKCPFIGSSGLRQHLVRRTQPMRRPLSREFWMDWINCMGVLGGVCSWTKGHHHICGWGLLTELTLVVWVLVAYARRCGRWCHEPMRSPRLVGLVSF